MKRRHFSLLILLVAASILHVQCTKDDENGTGGGGGGGGGPHISYADYGAVGDGLTDDFDAIIRAHEAANMMDWPVRAVSGKTYRIGGANKTAIIQTSTDWTGAKFIIDDLSLESITSQVFQVSSKTPSQDIKGKFSTLTINQSKVTALGYPAVIVATDSNIKRYIRSGGNANTGSNQTDVFVVDKDGNVDMKAPIIWDFTTITSLVAWPIDETTLTIKGGTFTTLANAEQPNNPYHNRGIAVQRSNVVIDGLQHIVVDPSGPTACYNGFLSISNCTGIMVKNCTFTGRTYNAVTRPSGTYDLSATRAMNITYKDCKQYNDIHDSKYWGILGTNFCKNLTLDNVEFSRFDAHQGVTNGEIKNSTLGHQGINLIGFGTFTISNTKVCGSRFLTLRTDYGSTFKGDVIIRNCTYFPSNGKGTDAIVIYGTNSGTHNYGYTCYMPETITLENLTIDDSKITSGSYTGPKIFHNFNSSWTGNETYKYEIAKEVKIKNLVVKSGKAYIKSLNTKGMFDSVQFTTF